MKYKIVIKKCDDRTRAILIINEIARLSVNCIATDLNALVTEDTCIYNDSNEQNAIRLKVQLEAIGVEVILVEIDSSQSATTFDKLPPQTEEDEDVEGRILNDNEYMQELKTRHDIFTIEKNTTLHKIELITLIIAVIFGVWISTVEDGNFAPDLSKKIPKERIATLCKMNSLLTINTAVIDNNNRSIKKHTLSKSYVNRPDTIQNSPKLDSHKIPERMKLRFETDNKYDSFANSSMTQQTIDLHKPDEKDGKQSFTRQEDTIKVDTNITSKEPAIKGQANDTDPISLFRHTLKQNPRDTVALTAIGDLFLNKGSLDSAAIYYKAALAVNPHIAAVHNGFGTIHYYNSVSAKNPYYAERMNISDPVQYIKSQYDSAIAEYTNAIMLDSSDVEALTNRGVIRDLHHNYEDAIKDYSLAIKINPSYADAYNKRAAIFKSLGKYKDAINDYTAAIKLDSSSYKFNPTLRFANAYFGRGVAFYKRGDLDNAIADFDSTLHLSPEHSLAMINKAVALSDAKRYDSAISELTHAIFLLSPLEYDGAKMTAYLLRGNIYKSLGKYDLAIADYTNAIESSKLAAKSSWRVAECYSLNKNNDLAITWLKKSISFGFADFKAWRQDKDLASLWNTKEFHDIISKTTSLHSSETR